MKLKNNFIKHISILALSLGLIACQDKFLEETVYTFMSPNNYYNNANDAVIAVNSCYDILQERGLYQQLLYKVGDFASDIADNNGRLDQFHTFTVNSQNGDLYTIWQKSYDGINRCNSVIGRVPQIDMDTGLKNRVIGEARFLRGLLYFNLIRIYGNIPFVDKETTGTDNIEPSNVNTSDKVWQLIIDDLKFAEANLPPVYSGNDRGRATKGAAMGILAKVYLTRSGYGIANEWMMAASKAKDVMDLNVYGLYEDYTKNFGVSNKNGLEQIFQVQFVPGSGEGMARLEKDWGVRGVPTSNPYEGDSQATGTTNFYNQWDKDDKRYYTTWVDEFVNAGNLVTYPGSIMLNPHTRKYKIEAETIVRLDRFGQNVNVLRYSDVLLMHSEALNMAQGSSAESVKGINMVRERAGLAPIDHTTMNKEELRQAIIKERAFELCFEFHTFFDYQRQDVLREKMEPLGIIVENHRKFFPIPQRELQINLNLRQNVGY